MHLPLCNSYIQQNHSYGNAFIHNVNGNIYTCIYIANLYVLQTRNIGTYYSI